MNPGTPNGDEQASAELAEHRLAAAGLPRAEVHEVARLVLITAHHSPASADLAGTRVSDADLAILAAEPAATGHQWPLYGPSRRIWPIATG